MHFNVVPNEGASDDDTRLFAQILHDAFKEEYPGADRVAVVIRHPDVPAGASEDIPEVVATQLVQFAMLKYAIAIARTDPSPAVQQQAQQAREVLPIIEAMIVARRAEHS